MADIVKLIYKGDEMAQGGGSGSAPQATTSVIGTVRGATSQEVTQHAEAGSQGELLIMTPYQIASMSKPGKLHSTELNVTNTATGEGASAEISYTFPQDGFALIEWEEKIVDGTSQNYLMNRDETYYFSTGYSDISGAGLNLTVKHRELFAVPSGSRTFAVYNNYNTSSTIKLARFFYFD